MALFYLIDLMIKKENIVFFVDALSALQSLENFKTNTKPDLVICLLLFLFLITGYSLLRAPPRERIFACTAVCTPASRAVVVRLRGDLKCMLRICLYWREAIERERGGGMSVLGGGGSQREPQASCSLLTTFSLMDNHIGENLIVLWWLQPIEG